MRFRRPTDPTPEPAKSFEALSPPPDAPVSAFAPPTRTAPTLSELAKVTEADLLREDDLALLRALVPYLASEVEAHDEPGEDTTSDQDEERQRATDARAMFSDMLAKVERGRPGFYYTLTAKQRQAASYEAARREVEWGDPSARNRAVPKGKEVALLVDRMARPLAPPGRKPNDIPGRKV